MVPAGRFPWDALERWNGQAFVAIGLLLAGVALYKGADAFTAWTVSSAIDTGYGGLALVAPLVGFLGLYPRLRDAAPRLSTTGVVAAGVATTLVLAVWAWFFGTTLQSGRFPGFEAFPVWGAAALALVFITLSIGFLSFGVAGLRTRGFPPFVGLLLVIPAVMWIGLLVNVAVRAVSELDFFVYLVNSLVVLTAGYLLWTGDRPTGQGDPVSDTAA